MATYTKTSTSSKNTSSTSSHTNSQSNTQKVLDEALLETILGGLSGQMSAEDIRAYAESLLAPQLHAGLEAAQREYETTALSKRQEIDNLASQLAASIAQQNSAYRRSMADVETAALARGMGRSSYTLETLAEQGDALAGAVLALTKENERRSGQLQQQITQAAQHSEETKSRLNQDYASQLAAKIQEIDRAQREAADSRYLTAVSAAMGSKTSSESDTASSTQSSGSSTSVTTRGKTGSSSSSAKKKEQPEAVDAVSSAAPSVKQLTRVK